MRHGVQIGFTVLAATLMAGALRAQSTDVASDAQSGTGQVSDSAPSPSPASTPASSGNGAPTIYVPALDGTGLIALDHTIHTRFLYGANYTGGYDSNPTDLAHGPGSGTFLLSPFVGLAADTGTVQYVLQYQPTVRKYTNDRFSGGSLHTASVKVGGVVNERWAWDVRALGSHGLDSIRLLAPQQNVAIGDIPGTGPSAASYRPDAGTVTYIDGEAGLRYAATERDALAFTVENSFSSYTALPGDSNIALATASYTRSVTPKFQWINYAQMARYYGVIHCYTFGAGVGLEWKPQEHSYLRLTGGPQVDNSGCGKQQSFAYTADFSERITSKSQIYFSSARQIASTYLGPGLWQQTVSIGVQHDFDKDQSVGADFGYVGTSSLQGLMGYSGTYVDTAYSHRFGHSISAQLSYRRYAGDWTDASFTRNTALLSVSWTPSAGHIFQ